MSEQPTKSAILTAWLAIALVVGLIILGTIWYGVSSEVLGRIWRNTLAEPRGPMTYRFIVQPVMAALAALRDGIRDARLGHPPFLWAMVRGTRARGALIWGAIIATARIVILAIVMDGVYQWVVLKTFYPREAVAIALLLAFVPYLLLRGIVERVARRWNA